MWCASFWSKEKARRQVEEKQGREQQAPGAVIIAGMTLYYVASCPLRKACMRLCVALAIAPRLWVCLARYMRGCLSSLPTSSTAATTTTCSSFHALDPLSSSPSDTAMADSIPAQLKGLQLAPFAKRAAQLERFKPIVTYWCASA